MEPGILRDAAEERQAVLRISVLKVCRVHKAPGAPSCARIKLFNSFHTVYIFIFEQLCSRIGHQMS